MSSAIETAEAKATAADPGDIRTKRMANEFSEARDTPAAPSLNAASSSAGGVSEQPIVAGSPGGCQGDFCARASVSSSEPVLAEAGRRWAARPLPQRLEVVRRARHWIAAHPETFTGAISSALARTPADTLVAELLPLLDAMRFLERRALRLLAPRKLGRGGRPFWLAGVAAEIHHDPIGHVLVIGPANFPLFLPGVQVLQALVAGNYVTWKPGTGGETVARIFAHVLRESGLPRGVLHITPDSVSAGENALAHGPDKVVFTGSFATGRRVLEALATTATPSVMELSGADAVVVLPSADLALAARAIAFGLRLNGSEVCMSPRRVVGTRETLGRLRPLLQASLANVPPVSLSSATYKRLQRLTQEACAGGAERLPLNDVLTSSVKVTRMEAAKPGSTRPVLIDRATPDMEVTRTDLFAPVLSLLEAPSVLHLADIVNNNPYALTAAIFGNSREAEVLAAELRVGTVIINDLIAPTADPRIPFGGRRRSGFGVTRGAEGLLAMTATRTVLRRHKGVTRHYDPLGPDDLPLFAHLVGVLHGGSVRTRWQSLRGLFQAVREKTLKTSSKPR